MVLRKLSLVTGTRNRPDSFDRLYDSIQRHTVVDWELVVTDASDDEFPRPLHTLKNVFVLTEKPRRGMSAGYNWAFHWARGEWVIWLNDDCEVTPGYDTTAIQFMESHPEIGLGALYYDERLNGHGDFKVNYCCYGMLYANFGILRRTFGEQIGWFDEDIPMYGNDNSLAYRTLLAGYGIAAIPGAHIIHHSEDDACRRENNLVRSIEASVLKNKYGPHLEKMRAVYDATSLVTA